MLQAKNLFFMVIFMLLTTTKVAAQQGSLSGRVIDSETREAMVRTTLQLYRIGQKDTTFVKGVFSDANGRFTISSVNAGNYLLKLSYLGYKTMNKNVINCKKKEFMPEKSVCPTVEDVSVHMPHKAGMEFKEEVNKGKNEHVPENWTSDNLYQV